MFSMLLQNKIGQSLSQGSPLRRNETGKMKTKKSTNYDQYFSLSKRMRFPVKLGNNMRSYWRILTVFRLHMVKILKRMGLSIVRVHLEPSYLYCSAKSKNRAVVKTCSFFRNFKNCLKFPVRVYSGY